MFSVSQTGLCLLEMRATEARAPVETEKCRRREVAKSVCQNVGVVLRFVTGAELQVSGCETVGDAIDAVGVAVAVHAGRGGQEVGGLVEHALPLVEGIVHLLLDVRIELLVAEVSELNNTVDAVLLSSTDDTAGDNDGDVANAADIRVQPAVGDFLLVEGGRQRLGGGIDHVLSNADGLGENGAKTDTREDVHVVALSGSKELAAVLHGGEGRAGGKEAASLSVGNGLLEVTLRLAGGVGEGEDDGLVIQLGHLLEDVPVECTANCRQTHEDSGPDKVNKAGEGLVLTAIVVVSRKVDLVIGEFIAAVQRDKAIRVNEPEFAASFLFSQALLHEELNDLLRNTNTSAAGTKEDSTVVLGRHTRRLDRINETTYNDGSSSLDVVVEHAICVLVSL